MTEKLTRAIAIDFDGCLCENAWPEVGEPHWDVIHAAIREQVNGSSLILWTCRTGYRLSEAIEACESWGLTFDAVNENLPERVGRYGDESRKISADEYWDDRAVHMPEPPNAPLTLEELREMDGEPVWIEYIPSPGEETAGFCALVSADKEDGEVFLLNSLGGSSSYEEAWADIRAIYRRKPEGETI